MTAPAQGAAPEARPAPGPADGLFDGRRYLVTGLVNEESIAWHVAAALQRNGAQVVLTAFGRALRIARKAADLLPVPAEVLELDVSEDDGFRALAEQVEAWDRIDGVLHGIAFAPADALGGAFLTTGADSVLTGFRTSAYSLQQLAAALAPALARAPHGGSVVGLTVDTARVLPGYDWMGVFKSALASVAQYLAVYLGSQGIRVNLVAAGPVETISARGLPGFDDLADYYERNAPLGWNRDDPERVVGAVLFLLSDLSRWTTGEVLHADGGVHAVTGGIGPK